MAQLSRSTDVPCTTAPAEHLCHACQLGRHVRLPFSSSSSSHAAHAFDLVHCDLWTSPVLSLSGYKYYLVVVDDFSHYSWTFPLRAKSETFPTLLHFFAWVSTQFGLTVNAVQCDNGPSGVRVTLTPPPPLLTSWRPARLVVCSLVTPLDHKGYRCFDLTSRRVLVFRHVAFDESDFPYSTSSIPSPDPELESLFSTDPVV